METCESEQTADQNILRVVQSNGDYLNVELQPRSGRERMWVDPSSSDARNSRETVGSSIEDGLTIGDAKVHIALHLSFLPAGNGKLEVFTLFPSTPTCCIVLLNDDAEDEESFGMPLADSELVRDHDGNLRLWLKTSLSDFYDKESKELQDMEKIAEKMLKSASLDQVLRCALCDTKTKLQAIQALYHCRNLLKAESQGFPGGNRTRLADSWHQLSDPDWCSQAVLALFRSLRFYWSSRMVMPSRMVMLWSMLQNACETRRRS